MMAFMPSIPTEAATYSTAEQFLQPELQRVGSKGFWLWRRQIYRLTKDYWFEWGPIDARKRIFRKRGFEYDKASIPHFGGLIGFQTDGEVDASSMLHDNQWRDKGGWKLGEFEFQVQMPDGEWVLDTSRWTKAETNELYSYVSILGGLPKSVAGTQVFFLNAWPPNWFKGF